MTIKPPNSSPQSLNLPTSSLEGLLVLVAEDNADVRSFVTRALQSAGCLVTAVEDGQKALDLLMQGTFGVLVADIVMPNMDGIALALKAIRLDPDLKIVMISGYAQERMRAHNLNAAVHRILAKPFSLEEICEAVRDAALSGSEGAGK